MNRASFIPFIAAGALAVLPACERREPTPAPAPAADRPSTAAPDNSARNEADRHEGAKTPIDQSEQTADVRITAAIRRAIMDDKSMSVNAQNVKIITEQSGVVTLRGPVDSQAEKDAIEAKAKGVAGVTRVDNQLEVK